MKKLSLRVSKTEAQTEMQGEKNKIFILFLKTAWNNFTFECYHDPCRTLGENMDPVSLSGAPYWNLEVVWMATCERSGTLYQQT